MKTSAFYYQNYKSVTPLAVSFSTDRKGEIFFSSRNLYVSNYYYWLDLSGINKYQIPLHVTNVLRGSHFPTLWPNENSNIAFNPTIIPLELRSMHLFSLNTRGIYAISTSRHVRVEFNNEKKKWIYFKEFMFILHNGMWEARRKGNGDKLVFKNAFLKINVIKKLLLTLMVMQISTKIFQKNITSNHEFYSV